VSETNADRARAGFAAAIRGDLDAIAPLLDPDVKWHGGDPSAAGGCRNRDEVLGFMRQALNRRGSVQLVDVIDAGDKVVVILQPMSDACEQTSGAGEQTSGAGELTFPVAGELTSPVANLTTFRDGKVVEMVHYPNPDDAIAAARGTAR
jgi:ketosteroid isomerase-like protein